MKKYIASFLLSLFPAVAFGAALTSYSELGTPATTSDGVVTIDASTAEKVSKILFTGDPLDLLSGDGTWVTITELTGVSSTELGYIAGLDENIMTKLAGISVAAPAIQADDPDAASENGWYLATTSGDAFFKSADGLFNVSAGTYTADPTAPTIASMTIGSGGLADAAVFSEAMAGSIGTWTMNCSASGAITMTADGGTGDTRNFTNSPLVTAGETCTYDYTPDGTTPLEAVASGLAAVAVNDGAVTNESTYDPPLATAFAIDAAGTTLTMTTDENIQVGANGDGTWTLVCDTVPQDMGSPANLPSASAQFTVSVLEDQVCTVLYTSGGADRIEAVDDGSDMAGWTEGVAVTNGSTNTGITYLINEEFGAQPSGWTEYAGGNATINYNNTTTPLYSGGPYMSIAYNSSQDIVYIPHGSTNSEVWMAALIRVDTLPVSLTTDFLKIYNSTTELSNLRVQPDGDIELMLSGGTTQSTSSAAILPAGTAKYVQIRYVAGSGSNAIATFYTSSTGASGSWTQIASVTNGTATLGATLSRININASMSVSVDRVRISTSQVNY